MAFAAAAAVNGIQNPPAGRPSSPNVLIKYIQQRESNRNGEETPIKSEPVESDGEEAMDTGVDLSMTKRSREVSPDPEPEERPISPPQKQQGVIVAPQVKYQETNQMNPSLVPTTVGNDDN
jgi:hypothetical protein